MDMTELSDIDPKELADRMEASDALIEEDPKHLMDYADACFEESKDANKDVRRIWEETWRAYETKMDFTGKEDWQCQLALNDPFTACKQASAIIRKGLKVPNYFSVEGIGTAPQDMANFIYEMAQFWMDENHGNFMVNFTDAAEMGFAVGQSMEVIPTWDEEKGLVYTLIEPWKIVRDPDAKPRDPWSGMYWGHEEWIDVWYLKNLEKQGVLIPGCTDGLKEEQQGEDREKSAKRKDQYWERSKYRKSVKVREFRGLVLGKEGEILLPNAIYMYGGGELLTKPTPSPHVNVKWPGVSFSPLPHLMRFEGKGLLEGVLSLWKMTNNLFSLNADNLNWLVNKMWELYPDVLVNPGDNEVYPAKTFLKRAGTQGNAAINEVAVTSKVPDIMANLQYFSQKWENGTFVNQFVAGLPGQRTNITKGEVEIKTQQSLGVFDSIGSDIEAGAVAIILATIEVIMLNWTSQSQLSPTRVFPGPMGIIFANTPIEIRKEALKGPTNIRVTGISSQLKNAENVDKLIKIIDMKAMSPVFGKFIKPYQLLREEAELLGFYDADRKWMLSEEEYNQLMEMEAAMPQVPLEETKEGGQK